MNVKLLLIFGLTLGCARAGGTEVETEFHNPYRERLEAIRDNLRMMWDNVRECVRGMLLSSQLISGQAIKFSCCGDRYQAVDKYYKIKLRASRKFFLALFAQKFKPLGQSNPDEILYFVNVFNMFLGKEFKMKDSMKAAVSRVKYFVDASAFGTMMALAEDELEFYNEFHQTILADKLALFGYLDAIIAKRDKDLEELLKRRQGESKDEAEKEIEEGDGEHFDSLADELEAMDQDFLEQIHDDLAEGREYEPVEGAEGSEGGQGDGEDANGGMFNDSPFDVSGSARQKSNIVPAPGSETAGASAGKPGLKPTSLPDDDPFPYSRFRKIPPDELEVEEADERRLRRVGRQNINYLG